MKCSKCNNEVNSELNIAFCPVCGEIIKVNENKLDNDDLKAKIDACILGKQYDRALELAYNLDENSDNLKTIINIFNLYHNNPSENVVNNYAFKNEYLLETYRKAIEIDSNDVELKKSYEEFLNDYLGSLERSIESLKQGINQKKIELEKLNAMTQKDKIKHFNVILICCIATIVLGIVLGFVIDNKVVNIIGYILAALGTITTIVIAYITPSYDVNFQKKKVEGQLQASKEEIKETENLINELKEK